MRENLPYLNQERLNIIFDHVYDVVTTQKNELAFDDDRLDHLLDTLKSMQNFNYRYRTDDTRFLFSLFNPIFDCVVILSPSTPTRILDILIPALAPKVTCAKELLLRNSKKKNEKKIAMVFFINKCLVSD